jgi:DNA-directed RNA polymerase subunit RPC12/RpoP
MTQKLYKCFACGKMYRDEESAIKCHNAPIQLIVKKEGLKKPRFLGN